MSTVFADPASSAGLVTPQVVDAAAAVARTRPRATQEVVQDADQAVGARHALGQAISGVLAAIVALADPGLVIIGGSWGRHPAIMQAISSAFAGLPRQVPVRAAGLTDQPSLAGARSDAVRRLRSAIVAAAQPRRAS